VQVSLGRTLVAVVLTASLVAAGGGFAVAGTTGGLKGLVVSTAGAPVPAARVTATSPSQTTVATTDASGRFTILSLAPDTYTLTVEKDGFNASSIAGISIFADQMQNIHITLQPALRTIANVTSRSSMDQVKPGQTGDVYSVNSALTKAAQGLGGGGDLNNAYSAIATVPGAFVPPEQQGWAQVVYIRGGAFDQIGYEFDGVPVNRSFDNYPGGTAGTLGQQELQVYTGGGTAGESTSGLAGFINQVIKTGTFPGYASVDGGVGTPTYYHNLQFEVGGASPDRMFSYYVGVGGYNQDFRYLDQFNGSNLGDVWGFPTIAYNTTNFFNFAGVYPTCLSAPREGSGLYSGSNPSPVYDPFTYKNGQRGGLSLPANTENASGLATDPGCYNTLSPAYASYSNLTDRETVVNLHFGIAHHNDAGKDDIQILYNNNMLLSQFYSSPNDLGPNVISQLNQLDGNTIPVSGKGPGPGYPLVWGDFVTWPTGTVFGQSAKGLSAIPYYMPSSPGNRCANVAGLAGSCPAGTFSAVPNDARDGFGNNASIFKIQYQRNMGSNAYFRLYAYSFYSDWLQTSPLSWGTPLFGFGVTSYNYDLDSHTGGLAFSLADQVNEKTLLTFNANYTTATTSRFNNTQFNEGLDTDATSYTNGIVCFGQSTGKRRPCNDPGSSGTFGAPIPASYAAVPGASWQVTNAGSSGFLNQVTPKFTSLSFEDRWDPTDKLNVDFGLRDEIYQFDLSNTSNNGQNFWFLAGQNEFCYNPITLAPYVIPAKPASFQPAAPFVGFKCPVDNSVLSHRVQTVHPDGKDGHLLLSNTYSPTLTDYAFTPRLGATYTVDNNTVLRFSAGVYAQEPETYQVQYNARDSNLAFPLFQAFWQYGYTTPRHDPQVQYSTNYDASLEHRFKGTDMSVKITPYFRFATNQIYSTSLPYGLSGGLNTGVERADGVEAEFTKGDFNKNGWSFVISYTYLNSAERFDDFPGTSINPIDPYNQDIANFNGLTQAGGGAQCYVNNHVTGAISPDPSCQPLTPHLKNNSPPIWNPYYGMKPQALLGRNSWFPVGLDFPYLSPNTLTAVVNYKRNRFAITPALTLNEGAQYGNPSSVMGLDPRTCGGNSAGFTNSPISNPRTGNPLQADYTTCTAANTQNGTSPGTLFIPNPATGSFDSFGQYRQPWQLNLSLSMSYDINPRIKVTAVLASLLNACFGGSSTPWSKQFPPNSYTCGYITNNYYISNFYNGVSPNDRGANGVALNPAFVPEYIPAYADTNSFVLPVPFNMFVQFNIKL
jgi:Carboxypeptidase regulatory-like domain/TonB dependent receptor